MALWFSGIELTKKQRIEVCQFHENGKFYMGIVHMKSDSDHEPDHTQTINLKEDEFRRFSENLGEIVGLLNQSKAMQKE